jgi:hydrogenase maturation protease
MITPICVCGVGSPFGDDRIGWQAIDRLEKSAFLRKLPPGRVITCRCDRPGPRLLELLRGAEVAIIVDAIFSGAPPGTIKCILANSMATLRSPFSTHGLDLASTLVLGEALGQLPSQIFIYGVEISPARVNLPNDALSPALTAIIPALVKAIETKVKDFC